MSHISNYSLNRRLPKSLKVKQDVIMIEYVDLPGFDCDKCGTMFTIPKKCILILVCHAPSNHSNIYQKGNLAESHFDASCIGRSHIKMKCNCDCTERPFDFLFRRLDAADNNVDIFQLETIPCGCTRSSMESTSPRVEAWKRAHFK